MVIIIKPGEPLVLVDLL